MHEGCSEIFTAFVRSAGRQKGQYSKLVIDFHTHIFPDKMAPETIRFLEDKADIKAYGNGKRSGLLASMEDGDIAVSVVLPVVTKPRQFATINRCAAETTREFEGLKRRLISFGGIHPDTKDYRGELEQIRDLGLPGVKVHPEYQQVDIDDVRYIRIIQYARELGLYVTVHAGFDPGFPDGKHCTPGQIRNVLDEVSGDHLILAHLGGVHEWDDVEKLLIGRDVWFDTSAVCMSDISDEQYSRMIRSHGSGRILYATDWPWDDQKATVKRLCSLNLTAEEKDSILWRNGAAILGMKP